MNKAIIRFFLFFGAVFFNVFFGLPVEYSSKLSSLDNSSAPHPMMLIDLEKESKVTNGLLFTYKSRKAVSVSISGNFSSWVPVPMKRGVNGVWYYFYSVQSEEQVRDIKYKFYVDGIWIHDPRNPFKENDGAGSLLSTSSAPSPYYATNVTYKMTGKNTVEFRVYNSAARMISLVGDFNNWNPENDLMQRGRDGIWRLTKRLMPGTYRYIYLVDGKETPDLFNPQSSSTVNRGICSLIVIK